MTLLHPPGWPFRQYVNAPSAPGMAPKQERIWTPGRVFVLFLCAYAGEMLAVYNYFRYGG